MPTTLRESTSVARQIAAHNGSYEPYLRQLAELEVQRRKAAAIARRLKQAKFSVVKEVGDFDFTAVPKLKPAKRGRS